MTFAEFEQLQGTSIYVSATPADYELMKSEGVIVEQLIRPTGLVDPPLEVRVTANQIDDLLEEIDKRVKDDDKVLVTTITKRMAEELSKYFDRVGVRNRYIHSDVDTLERIQILEDLRAGMFDVLVGVNLLREGLDLPEVALVAILDADKEGFLRNVRSLTQIAGRAARHSQGNVILCDRSPAPTPCASPSSRATAGARNRCATTWSTACCRAGRRRAARGKAPCSPRAPTSRAISGELPARRRPLHGRRGRTEEPMPQARTSTR